jgi:cell division protein FtsI (penicillin-binding protein 3)
VTQVRRRRRRALRGTSLVRLRIGFLLIAMVVSVFAVRLFELQGVDAQAYVAKARAEGVVTVTLPATRGSITDRNGVPLADSVDGLMLVADPTLTRRHASQIATVIARRLDVDYFDVLQRLRKPYTRFQYIARRVPATEARGVVEELDRRGYKGIATRRDPVRSYPAGDVAANIVGFMNAEGQAGEGTELMFDKVLAGKDGRATYEVGGGNRIPLGDNSTVPARSGHDVHLTIDRDVQWYAQRALRDAVQSSRSDDGVAVVMDVHTGELLALADYPTFDPNDYAGVPKKVLGSRALRTVYEPGSVEKLLTTSALLNDHLVTPRTKIVVPPELPVADRVIHDDVTHPTWKLTLTGAIARSSNIGITEAAGKISSRRLHHYLSEFGLGRPTGLGVHGESAGLLPPWQTWGPVNKANIAFGQGVAVTAVQMAAAVNTIANGGEYVAPSIIKGRATTNDGTVVGSGTATRHRVISAATAREETSMMETVTKAGGTAPRTAIPGYNVAGKTGTAEKVDQRCHCYSSARVVSFAGFAPADKPRFLVYVVADHPRNGGFGSTVAGPVFRELMAYVLQKYAVPPTGHLDRTPPLTW